MPRAFIPYGKQWVDDADVAAVVDVLHSDFLTQGPRVESFERKLCALTGAKHCVAVSNGTTALHLAVAALNLKPGRSGVTSAITFAASANALAYNGLKPILADIEPDTANISVASVEKRLTKSTAVLVPVHFAGQPADMPRLAALARRRKLRVVEDAAHAIGSRYADGTPVGGCRHSDLTTFSFHPVKTITSGEGGAVTTNDPALYARMKLLRTHGITKDVARSPGPWYYEMRELGFNFRLTDLQAALGESQLGKLDAFVARRRALVARYDATFAGHPLVAPLVERPGVFSAFHLYVLRLDFRKLGTTRAAFMAALAAAGVGTQVHYIPVGRLPYYRKTYGTRPSDCPAAEAFYERALTLPLYPKMSDDDADHVVKTVLAQLARRA